MFAVVPRRPIVGVRLDERKVAVFRCRKLGCEACRKVVQDHDMGVRIPDEPGGERASDIARTAGNQDVSHNDSGIPPIIVLIRIAPP